jgi:hypothetical protein
MLWDAGTGKRIRLLESHQNTVFTVAWSPDGRTLVSGSADRTLRLWDSDGSPRGVVDLPDSVQRTAFSATGELLAAKLDDSVLIWLCSKWECVAVIPCAGSEYHLPCLAFHPGKYTLATLGKTDRMIRLWDLDFTELLTTAPRPRVGNVREVQERPGPLIFFSYAREDYRQVSRIHDFVKEFGFKTWIDRNDLVPGQDWDYEISTVIDSASACLVFISSRSVGKTGYVNKEIKKILDRMDLLPEGKILMIPVRLDDCPIPRRLQRWHVLDFQDSDFRSRLISAIRHVL